MWTGGHFTVIFHILSDRKHVFLDRLQHAKKRPKNLANSFSDVIAILKKKTAGIFVVGDKSHLRFQVPLDKSVNLTS